MVDIFSADNALMGTYPEKYSNNNQYCSYQFAQKDRFIESKPGCGHAEDGN